MSQCGVLCYPVLDGKDLAHKPGAFPLRGPLGHFVCPSVIFVLFTSVPGSAGPHTCCVCTCVCARTHVSSSVVVSEEGAGAGRRPPSPGLPLGRREAPPGPGQPTCAARLKQSVSHRKWLCLGLEASALDTPHCWRAPHLVLGCHRAFSVSGLCACSRSIRARPWALIPAWTTWRLRPGRPHTPAGLWGVLACLVMHSSTRWVSPPSMHLKCFFRAPR